MTVLQIEKERKWVEECWALGSTVGLEQLNIRFCLWDKDHEQLIFSIYENV